MFFASRTASETLFFARNALLFCMLYSAGGGRGGAPEHVTPRGCLHKPLTWRNVKAHTFSQIQREGLSTHNLMRVWFISTRFSDSYYILLLFVECRAEGGTHFKSGFQTGLTHGLLKQNIPFRGESARHELLLLRPATKKLVDDPHLQVSNV